MEETILSIQGWLREKSSIFQFEHRYFCVLTDLVFCFYAGEDLVKLEKSFELSQVLRVTQLPGSSRPGFHVDLKNGQGFTFFDTSIHQAQKWICALQTEPTHEKLSIDAFELLKVIGCGSQGKVFLAKRKGREDIFAIKVIRKDDMPQEMKEKRVVQERNALMRAKHPFITRLYYAFQSPTKLYFVMEYVSGGDLRHHIDNGVFFSRNQVQLYIAELVLALRNLHNIGIIYRDLKPENILLDHEGHIKLADFGLARELNTESEATSLCGTCEYIAPEMILHVPQTYAIDWWALGVITYQLLVGKLPFASANKRRLFELIENSNPRMPSSLDQTSASFVSELLRKNPTERLGSIGTDITSHQFFAGIDWNNVANRQYKPEFVPDLESPDSVENFDDNLTTQDPSISSFDNFGALQMNVQGFSYVDNSPSRDIC